MTTPEKRTVFVAGFVTDTGTGGFEWNRESEVVSNIRKTWVMEGNATITQVREVELPPEDMHVPPVSASNEAITAWLDANPELWEPEEGERPSPLERLMAHTDELEHNEIMQQVFTVILDREEDDVLTIEMLADYLNEEGPDLLYMDHIAPAIDDCESSLREWHQLTEDDDD